MASIPAEHPYVRHLSDPQGPGGALRLPDPRPLTIDPAPDQWWPPRILELDWIGEHRGEFDLVHLHFGFDDCSVEHLHRWTALLQTHGIPLVMTVHDLVNPHFLDPARHRAQLDVLVPAAAGLITLTGRAAAVIRDRWHRDATVIPHPHIVPLPWIAQPVSAREKFVIGVHAKSLRANIDPLPILQELLPALAQMPGVVLRLDAHTDLLTGPDPDARAVALREWIASVQGHQQVQVEVHERLGDSELWDYLQSIDLCILPYRFGTHSGWLEACVDLGTAVLVPATGCYGDQHGHPVFGPGTAGLVDRIRAIVADPGLARPTRPDRLRQRHSIALAHEQVYRRVLRNRSPGRADPSNSVVEGGHT